MVVEGVTGAVGEVEEEDQGVVRPAEEPGTREGLPVRARIGMTILTQPLIAATGAVVRAATGMATRGEVGVSPGSSVQ